MAAVVLLAVLRLTLRLELGPEYDSNANRTEVIEGAANPDPPTGSALLRTTARIGLQHRRGPNLLRLQAGLGAKFFFNPLVADQSVLVVQGSIEDRVRLASRVDLAFLGDYYDAFQDLIAPACTTCIKEFRRRDFRTGTAGLRLTLYEGPGSLWLTGGYRGFGFKPDEYFNFHAPTGDVGATVSHSLGPNEDPHEVTFAATYHIERRAYGGSMQYLGPGPDREGMPCRGPGAPIVDGCLVTGQEDRADWFHEAGAEVGYLGVLLASLGYHAQINRSNSFGQSLLRFRFSSLRRRSYPLVWHPSSP